MTSTAVVAWMRRWVRPEYREKAYNLVGALVVVLGSWGVVDNNTAATLAQLVLAVVALLFAILYSTSQLRVALYGVLTATQAAAALWSIGNDAKWAGVLAMAAAVLGTQVAAARTPAPYDQAPGVPIGRHRVYSTPIEINPREN